MASIPRQVLLSHFGPGLEFVRSAGSSASLVVRAIAYALVERAIPPNRRDPTLWVFGARGGDGFVDNSKYLFLHVANRRPEIRAVWLSRDEETVATLRSRGYEAYHPSSLRGAVLTLRAGFVIVTQGLGDVTLAAASGATVVNLWHGIPLKRIGWDAERGEKPLPARLAYAYLDNQVDLLTVPGAAAVDPCVSGLRVDPGRIAVTGYPRTDVLVRDVPGMEIGTSTTTIERVRRLADRGRIIVYLPTFRDYADETFADAFEFDRLDALLADHDAYFLIKTHPHDRIDLAGSAPSRIRQLPSDIDVYPLLRHTDGLVTDYSSILFDYLLLDAPIIFYPYDLERYGQYRQFNFEYEAVTPGPVAGTFEEFLEALDATLTGKDAYRDERRAVRDRFFEHPPGCASHRVYARLSERMGPNRPVQRSDPAVADRSY